MNIQDSIYQSKDNTTQPRFVRQCPVCGDMDVIKSIDNPDTNEICKSCESQWNEKGKLILDSRENLTEIEILKKGWFIDVKY